MGEYVSLRPPRPEGVSSPGRATDGIAGAAAAPAHERTARRLRSLDAIRGIAALLVVFGHSAEQAVKLLPDGGVVRAIAQPLVVNDFNLGRVGVIAFFILSGYVIPFSFSHTRPVLSFLTARLFRLYPAYWVSLLLALPVTLLVAGAWPPPQQILANATMVQAALGQPDLIGVYWTLFYELLFYACCLFAFVNGWLESPRYLLVAIVGLSAVALLAGVLRASNLFDGLPVGVPMFLGIMHLGTLTRLVDRGDGPLANRCQRIGAIAVFATAGPASAFGFVKHTESEFLVAGVTGLYAGLLLFFGLRKNEAICRPVLLFLGLISYSLYLFHPLVLLPAIHFASDVDVRYAPALMMLTVPALSVVLAVLAQTLVEAPGNRLGKRIRSRLVRA